MYDSDRKYLSRFALDPDVEYGSEDLYETDYRTYAAINGDQDSLCSEDLNLDELILEDDFLFED